MSIPKLSPGLDVVTFAPEPLAIAKVCLRQLRNHRGRSKQTLTCATFEGIELDRAARRRPFLWLFGWRQALFSLAGGQYGSEGSVRQPRAEAWSIRVRIARPTIGRVSLAR